MSELCPSRSRPRRLLGLGLSCAAALALSAACGSGEPFQGAAGAAGGGSGGRAGSSAGAATSAGGSDNVGGAGAAEAGGAAGEATEPPASGAGPGPLTCEAGYDDCNGAPADGCETKLDTASACGSCDNVCDATSPECALVGEQYACVNPAQALAGQRLELPCVAPTTYAELCESVSDRALNCPKPGGKVSARSLKVTGRAGVLYDVTLRIRGVLEPRAYVGGTAGTDHFYVGGTGLAPSNYNTFSVTVSAPAQTYYLNHDDGKGEAYGVFALDHEKVIQVEGGATLKLEIVDPDCAMVKNCKSFSGACSPYVIPGVAPATGYDGQFAQVDVVSVALAQ